MLKKKPQRKQRKIKNSSLNHYSSSDLSRSTKRQFLDNYLLGLNGNSLFFNKGLLLNEPELLKNQNQFILNLPAFYRTKLLLFYRKRLVSHDKNFKQFKFQPKFLSFLKNHTFFKENEVLVNVSCLNRNLSTSTLRTDYSFYKHYKHGLFVRNHNLWLDFIKVTNLVIHKQLNAKALLLLFGALFKYLNKRKHSKFILFVSCLFDHLIRKYPNQIRGLKLVISGRLLSKPRSSVAKIERGTLNLTSKDADLSSSQMHVYTLYGAFGLKLYINYKK